MSNGDAWKTPGGKLGTEVDRQEREGRTNVKIVLAGDGFNRVRWFDLMLLTPETPRYEGRDGGRA